MTNNEGPQKNKPCKFPFTIKRKDGNVVIHKRCTKEYDKNEKAWCPTSNWKDHSTLAKPLTRENYPSDWGYCSSDCAIDETGKLIFIKIRLNPHCLYNIPR